jgi:hypothetical protein
MFGPACWATASLDGSTSPRSGSKTADSVSVVNSVHDITPLDELPWMISEQQDVRKQSHKHRRTGQTAGDCSGLPEE